MHASLWLVRHQLKAQKLLLGAGQLGVLEVDDMAAGVACERLATILLYNINVLYNIQHYVMLYNVLFVVLELFLTDGSRRACIGWMDG